MLKELKVRDLALVAESTVRFGPGLNLLTGETGSGKSLIIDALSLALGARGGADQVRYGADRATIEAAFDGVVRWLEVGTRSAARTRLWPRSASRCATRRAWPSLHSRRWMPCMKRDSLAPRWRSAPRPPSMPGWASRPSGSIHSPRRPPTWPRPCGVTSSCW